jgi:hypothetical protein
MYSDDANNSRRIEGAPVDQSAIARFEAWLRSHGYDPDHDPFMPDEASLEASTDASDLVREYLKDRPSERRHLCLLARHAREIGGVSVVWGDGGCCLTWE